MECGQCSSLSPRALLSHTHTHTRPGPIQPRRLTAFLYTLLTNAVVWPQSVPPVCCCIVIASTTNLSLSADCVSWREREIQVRDLSSFLTWQRGLVKSIFIINARREEKRALFFYFKNFPLEIIQSEKRKREIGGSRPRTRFSFPTFLGGRRRRLQGSRAMTLRLPTFPPCAEYP